MMMNHMYRMRPDGVGEDDLDPLDFSPLESSLGPLVTDPVKAEEEAEDVAGVGQLDMNGTPWMKTAFNLMKTSEVLMRRWTSLTPTRRMLSYDSISRLICCKTS